MAASCGKLSGPVGQIDQDGARFEHDQRPAAARRLMIHQNRYLAIGGKHSEFGRVLLSLAD
jgi:hypothetical protein